VQFAVETPKLDRMVALEKGMQVEEMIAAGMVMLVSALAVSLVPDVFDLLKGFRPFRFDSFDQPLIHGFAIGQPLRFYLQGFVKKVVLRSNDVDEVPYALRGMVRSVKVDMDSTPIVRESARYPQLPYQLLQGFDILAIF
jgi:hypothetical protein